MEDRRKFQFAELSFGTQVRKSPYTDAALRWGATGLSVYNHMYIPRDFGDPVENFWHLVNDAILWAKGVAVNSGMDVQIDEPARPDDGRRTAVLHRGAKAVLRSQKADHEPELTGSQAG